MEEPEAGAGKGEHVAEPVCVARETDTGFVQYVFPGVRITARELEDAATDLGTPVSTLATRQESAQALAQTYPQAPLPQVATAVDAGVFGPGCPEA